MHREICVLELGGVKEVWCDCLNVLHISNLMLPCVTSGSNLM